MLVQGDVDGDSSPLAVNRSPLAVEVSHPPGHLAEVDAQKLKSSQVS